MTKFHAFLKDKRNKGEEYSEGNLPLVYGRETWHANDFYTSLANWEEHWVNTPKQWKKLGVGNGDELKVALARCKKWKPVIDKTYKNTDHK